MFLKNDTNAAKNHKILSFNSQQLTHFYQFYFKKNIF